MDNLPKIYSKSKDILELEVEGRIIIIPITSGMVDLENVLTTSLNEMGRDIWLRIDGRRNVLDIVGELESIYEVNTDKLTEDVLVFLDELAKRKFILHT